MFVFGSDMWSGLTTRCSCTTNTYFVVDTVTKSETKKWWSQKTTTVLVQRIASKQISHRCRVQYLVLSLLLLVLMSFIVIKLVSFLFSCALFALLIMTQSFLCDYICVYAVSGVWLVMYSQNFVRVCVWLCIFSVFTLFLNDSFQNSYWLVWYGCSVLYSWARFDISFIV